MASQTDLPTITISPDILRLLLRDCELANSLVNEILARMLKDEPLGDDDQLVDRPDWQAAVEAGSKARAEGNVVTHEDVLAWHNQHPSSGRSRPSLNTIDCHQRLGNTSTRDCNG